MGRARKSFSKQDAVKFPRHVTGLEGVMTIFNVSKATASRYVNTFLAPAVTRQGNIIFVDVIKALKCFGVPNPSSFVKH